VDEPVVDAGLVREAPRRDARVAHLDEQPLGGVEQAVFGTVARRRPNSCISHLPNTFD
jgi:hypothetical protein